MTVSVVSQKVKIEALSDDLSLKQISSALESVGIHPTDIIITPFPRDNRNDDAPCHSSSDKIS